MIVDHFSQILVIWTVDANAMIEGITLRDLELRADS